MEKTVRIERCKVSGYGNGYKIVDATTGDNVWNIWYTSTTQALADCREFTVVEVCISWPLEYDDEGEDDYSVQYPRYS
jgi:hypothetical protein